MEKVSSQRLGLFKRSFQTLDADADVDCKGFRYVMQANIPFLTLFFPLLQANCIQ